MIATQPIVYEQLLSFCDTSYSGFKGFPESYTEAATKWADTCNTLLSEVIPISTTTAIAYQAFIGAMSTLGQSSNGIILLENAFLAYATALVPGMLPSFIGTPPPAKPSIQSLMRGPLSSNAPFSNSLATLLVAWAKSGTATPSSGGTPINWN